MKNDTFSPGDQARVVEQEPTDAQWRRLPKYYGQKDPSLWQWVGGRTFDVFSVDEDTKCVCLNIGGVLVWFLEEWLISASADRESKLEKERKEGQRQIAAVNKKRDDMLRELFTRK